MAPKSKTGEKKEGKVKMSAKTEKMTFEEALLKLEEIVQKMEDTDLPLEDTMDAYEEGILLTNHCRKKQPKTIPPTFMGCGQH